jgi:hypothetical protein
VRPAAAQHESKIWLATGLAGVEKTPDLNQGMPMTAQHESDHLRTELEGLLHDVQRVRQEIATLFD